MDMTLFPRAVPHFAGVRGARDSEAREQAEALRELCRELCQLHGIEVEQCGQLPERPVVIVANHLGYIDPLVLCSLLPCSPIAKSEIADWPLIGALLRRRNVSFVRRGSAHSGARVLKRCLGGLRAGVSVLNFPEGTTSRGGLLPFQMGAFWLARRSGLPILPVAMDFESPAMCWVGDDAFLPHYSKLLWGKLRGQSCKVRVAVGDLLDPARFRSELDLCWATRGAITRLRHPYPALEEV
ncbi:MAG TPA: lysophospholipid acyltransferase family protein [Polyangiaceae bacterium]|nr:lysophospholipid acyltransferase family protein [Polyangiaceae bacterium]